MGGDGTVQVKLLAAVIAVGILGACIAAGDPPEIVVEHGFEEDLVTEDAHGAVVLRQRREVLPGILEVTETRSYYAHNQHLVFVQGRYNRERGRLLLVLMDGGGEELESAGFREPEITERLDGEWITFDHKLIEDTWSLIDSDRGIICFELRDENDVTARARVRIPLRKPGS
ncbi:MAG: hypothetical protein R6U70_07935 [Bacillota bacterium]